LEARTNAVGRAASLVQLRGAGVNREYEPSNINRSKRCFVGAETFTARLEYQKVSDPTASGRLCLHRKRINISAVLAGQRLGIKEVDDGIWLASFMHYDLGYFDLEQKTLQRLDNPFGTRLSPMS
jgi:hypothetical protein